MQTQPETGQTIWYFQGSECSECVLVVWHRDVLQVDTNTLEKQAASTFATEPEVGDSKSQ